MYVVYAGIDSQAYLCSSTSCANVMPTSLVTTATITSAAVFIGTYTGNVLSCPLGESCSGTALFTSGNGGIISMTSDSSNIYFSDTSTNLWYVLNDTPGEAQSIATTATPASGLTTSGDGYLYFITDDGITNCYFAFCTPELVVSGNVAGMTVDSNNIYFTSDSGLNQCLRSNCQPVTLFSLTYSSVAVDFNTIYFIGDDSATIYSCAIGGCSSSPTVVDSPSFTENLVFSGTTLFWMSMNPNGYGSIGKLFLEI